MFLLLLVYAFIRFDSHFTTVAMSSLFSPTRQLGYGVARCCENVAIHARTILQKEAQINFAPSIKHGHTSVFRAYTAANDFRLESCKAIEENIWLIKANVLYGRRAAPRATTSK
jgi:hypothetical protein